MRITEEPKRRRGEKKTSTIASSTIVVAPIADH
jgi:hypothetical protein